jgi:tRNA A58 N-methylase Trm61
MGIITNWLGCTPEAAIIEFGTGTLIFFCWFFTMKFLGRYYDRKQNSF